MLIFHLEIKIFFTLKLQRKTPSLRIFVAHVLFILKVQPCKLCNNKYMIASTQITNTEIFALISVLVFKLLSRNVLFINGKDNRNR